MNSGKGAFGYATKHMNTSSSVYDGHTHRPILIARETVRRPAVSALSGVGAETTGIVAAVIS